MTDDQLADAEEQERYDFWLRELEREFNIGKDLARGDNYAGRTFVGLRERRIPARGAGRSHIRKKEQTGMWRRGDRNPDDEEASPDPDIRKSE